MKNLKFDFILLWFNIQNLNTSFDSVYQCTHKNSKFDDIKQSLIVDPVGPNVDQFCNEAQHPKYNYTVRLSILKNGHTIKKSKYILIRFGI